VAEGDRDVWGKLARATQLLFYRRHRQPGARGWELKRALGRNYLEIIRLLDQEIQKIGLQVKEVPEGDDPESTRFYIVLKGSPPLAEARTFGWRIDDMAILAVTLAYILSTQGKAPAKEVERVLSEKFPKWKIERNLDRFIRMGYISKGEKDLLYLGWRSMVEVDQKTLLSLLLGRDRGESKDAEGELDR